MFEEGISKWAKIAVMIGMIAGTAYCLIPHVLGATTFTITPDKITDTGIVWNLSNAPPGTLSYYDLYLDGIEVNEASVGPDTPPDVDNNRIVIQSGLKPGEWHSIAVNLTSGGTVYQGSAIAQTTNTPSADSLVWANVLIYLWAIAAILLIIAGVYIARIFHLLSAFFSLIGLVNQSTFNVSLDFSHISFYIYIILLIIGVMLYAFNATKTRYL